MIGRENRSLPIGILYREVSARGFPTSFTTAMLTAHGQAWGTLINNLASAIDNAGYSDLIVVAGGIDAEAEYSSAQNARSWVGGYVDTSSTAYDLFDYGSANTPRAVSVLCRKVDPMPGVSIRTMPLSRTGARNDKSTRAILA